MAQRQARLVSQIALSPAVNLLRLQLEGDDPFIYEAGQWANLNLPDRPTAERRAYSIASAPEPRDGRLLEVAVTQVEQGCLSPALHRLAVGDPVTVDGPHGFFTREGDALAKPALFVGTGSGVAPLRAMLQVALGDPSTRAVPLRLLFGCRTEADILFRQELSALAQQHPNFGYRVTLSRGDGSWHGLRGYVQSHLPMMLAEQRAEHVYVCGLSAMVKAVRAELKTLGYGRGTIHTERFD